MNHSHPSSFKTIPSWTTYAHELVARQQRYLLDQAAFDAILPAAQAARSPDPDRPTGKATSAADAGPADPPLPRPRRPLASARLLALLRLAATFSSADAFAVQLTDHPMTLLRGFSTPELSDVAKVVGRLMVPEGWEYLFRSSFETYRPPAAIVLRPEAHRDIIDEASIDRFADHIAEAIESGLPLMLLVPDEVTLPEELSPALPAPILLAPLSRQILLAALDAWHPDAAIMDDASLSDRLPDNATIARLTPLTLRLALAAPSVEEAIAQLAQPAPKPVASGPDLDQIAEDNPALPTARRIVADLQDWQAGKVAWSDLTRSMLLYGPPGTGKTWMAQAMAASAGIEHVTGSFAAWQATGHLGNMLSAMRSAFAQAFACAPAILTIDAVGSREDSDTHARSYRTQVINAFLEQMDMIGRKQGVIVVATCNHPERIDPAILRAGRFDLKLGVGRPGPVGIAQILRNKLGDGYDSDEISTLARAATGCTPAEIDAAVRMARSICRSERRDLYLDDIRNALVLPPPHDRLEWRVALHEAGHAVVCATLGLGQITRITLTPRGGEIARTLPHHEMRLTDYEAEIAYALAGRCAEQLMLGNISAGAGGEGSSDLAIATRIAATIETCYGLGAHGSLWTGKTELDRLSPELQTRVRERLTAAEAQAMHILRACRDQLQAIACDLQQQRHLSGETLLQHLAYQPPDPS